MAGGREVPQAVKPADSRGGEEGMSSDMELTFSRSEGSEGHQVTMDTC